MAEAPSEKEEVHLPLEIRRILDLVPPEKRQEAEDLVNQLVNSAIQTGEETIYKGFKAWYEELRVDDLPDVQTIVEEGIKEYSLRANNHSPVDFSTDQNRIIGEVASDARDEAYDKLPIVPSLDELRD
jgi:hypothetical protein